MAYMPMQMFGRTRLVMMDVDGDAKAFHREKTEELRRIGIAKRREYYRGDQFDEDNYCEAEALGLDPIKDRLPEHKRLHAYSTQIKESIDFLSARLGEGFTVEADDQEVKRILDEVITRCPILVGHSDTGETQTITDDVLRDALIAGDTAVFVGWDVTDDVATLEFWESESVEWVQETTGLPEKVIRRAVVWRKDPDGSERQVTERVEYSVETWDEGVDEDGTIWERCVARTFWDNDEEPREVRWMDVPFIPWVLLTPGAEGLRAVRGDSLISEQAMECADRYNAVEQVSWLIARYNSHGNLAVTGDQAMLQLETDGRVSKDVADVLRFPGGTAVEAITLPTDPAMIEHQRRTLLDALYGCFGLARSDPESVVTSGPMSGYALEITNQKTETTFNRIRRQWRKSWIGLANMILDRTVYGRAGDDWIDAEPEVELPNRKMAIHMGSGYIVDDVKIRDDFISGLISLQEALRQRGYDDTERTKITAELKAEDPVIEVGRFESSGRAGTTLLESGV